MSKTARLSVFMLLVGLGFFQIGCDENSSVSGPDGDPGDPDREEAEFLADTETERDTEPEREEDAPPAGDLDEPEETPAETSEETPEETPSELDEDALSDADPDPETPVEEETAEPEAEPPDELDAPPETDVEPDAEPEVEQPDAESEAVESCPEEETDCVAACEDNRAIACSEVKEDGCWRTVRVEKSCGAGKECALRNDRPFCYTPGGECSPCETDEDCPSGLSCQMDKRCLALINSSYPYPQCFTAMPAESWYPWCEPRGLTCDMGTGISICTCLCSTVTCAW